mmetsp:Transcript_21195/g.48733  ORF Transcript_21195/g.48733 Transcript_21195/m.48733 type:complete len:212 (+) Transcript_21195:437-1072(+)
MVRPSSASALSSDSPRECGSTAGAATSFCTFSAAISQPLLFSPRLDGSQARSREKAVGTGTAGGASRRASERSPCNSCRAAVGSRSAMASQSGNLLLGKRRASSSSGLNDSTKASTWGAGGRGACAVRQKREKSAMVDGSDQRCNLRRHMMMVPVTVRPSRQWTYSGCASGVMSNCKISAARSCVSITSSLKAGTISTWQLTPLLSHQLVM